MTKHKNHDTAKRMKHTAEQHVHAQERKAFQEQQTNGKQLTVKDIENILIDLSLQAAYNQGDKKEINFIVDVLQPNKINIPEGTPMESIWDKISNSGVLKPGIGFGSANKLSITPQGYEIMENYGSYIVYLQTQQQQQALKAQMMQKAADTGNVMVVSDAGKNTTAENEPKVKKAAPITPDQDDHSNFE